MAKLFISYPSESWNFAQRIAEGLAKHLEDSIFIDYRSVDNPDFEVSILGHLRSSHALLLIITKFTFEDIHRDGDWVRREIRTALENDIPIVLVREDGLLPPRDLPEDVRSVSRSQGFPFYREFFDPGVVLLYEFLINIGVGTPRTSINKRPTLVSVSEKPAPKTKPEPQKELGGKPSFDEAIDLLEAGDFDKALFILEALGDKGYRGSMAAAITDLIQRASAEQEQVKRRHEAELDYEDILLLARGKFTEPSARVQFTAWCEMYSDLCSELDIENLRRRFATSGTGSLNAARRTTGRLGTIGTLSVPSLPFSWIDIPGTKGKTWMGVPYSIAKYPVTNAQYAKFIDAGGYRTESLWTPQGWAARVAENWMEPRYWQDAVWNNLDHPVVGVSWYEAVAFCQWLSESTGEPIFLPTEEQWQYAAQGDDGREYPWGSQWDRHRLNSNVDNKGTKRTTPVYHYEGSNGRPMGESFFGVVDMAGNVWEWCLTDYDTLATDVREAADSRVLRGGSWRLSEREYYCASVRFRESPVHWSMSFGFRVVRYF